MAVERFGRVPISTPGSIGGSFEETDAMLGAVARTGTDTGLVPGAAVVAGPALAPTDCPAGKLRCT